MSPKDNYPCQSRKMTESRDGEQNKKEKAVMVTNLIMNTVKNSTADVAQVR